ncbi:MAG: SUMF1/EgtB/PvdO family nonheme iron enzyme [Polyangiaceae bacterium]|nr:SUMF1/EgtB/PvdO family nonheme iron enzyme [Polyangiaceae bacterium]
MSRLALRVAGALALGGLLGCEPLPAPAQEPAQSSPAAQSARTARRVERDPAPPGRRAARPAGGARKRAASRPGETKAQSAACPAEMALVEGNHCRSVEQPCLEPMTDAKRGPDKNRCQRFGASRCTDPKPPRAMRFCMDRHEYPGKPGELPMTLVSWTEASRLCEAQGKRLCTESEFTFACEGEEMRPYAVGFERRPDQCNIDRPYLTPTRKLLPGPLCEANAACQAEMKRIDGRRPIGESEACASPFGIFDLNGNANEWVSRPWKEQPHRSAIKGGWWGPVRNRCRAMTTAHDESYLGYEVGFRCCGDAAPAIATH